MKEINVSLLYKLELGRRLKQSLKCIMFWSKLFGVTPININFESTENQNQSIFSKDDWKSNCLFVVHLIWSILILASISTAIYYERTYDERDSVTFILKCLYLGEYFFNIFNCSLIVVSCHYQRLSYKKYFNKIINIDMKLKACGEVTDFSKLTNYINRFWTFSAMFMVLATIFDYLYYVHVKDFIRSVIVFILAHLLTIIILIEYFAMLHVLKERYKCILNALKRLEDQNDECRNRKSVVTLTLLETMYIKEDPMVDPDASVLQRLNMLRNIYYDLTMFNEDINSSFGIIIISIILTAFVVVSTQLYAFYDLAKNTTGINIYLAIYSGLWFILNSGKVFLILLLNDHVCVEKSSIGSLLHNLNFNKANRQIQASIYKFSMQIFHLQRYQAITGILELDLRLLTNLVGSLTTNFVILIQFSENGAKNNS